MNSYWQGGPVFGLTHQGSVPLTPSDPIVYARFRNNKPCAPVHPKWSAYQGAQVLLGNQDHWLRKPRIFVVYVIYRKRIEITIETLTLRSGFGNWLLWARSQPNHSREHADYSQGGGFPRP